MALHEQSTGATDEWYTPAYVFEAMGVRFDLDVAHPEKVGLPVDQWCDRCLIRDALRHSWEGFVWMNPPFGGRNALIPWLQKFFDHGDGVALVPDRTSAPWWQRFAPQASAVLFVSPKIKFIGIDGLLGRSPAQGTCLLAAGNRGQTALVAATLNGLGAAFKKGIGND